ncbi:hypothetical protein ACFQ21_22895 [Ohtaekwangia kribbensis]|jgi:hypothetical protein|uniref:Uncharacterized protein n=1 Tax=Ohtaekwangia kribbensis TaxID=688913 RepID=A0ABW3K7E8_9BACT
MQTFFENKSAKVYYDTNLDTLFLEYTDKVANHEQFVVINAAVLKAFENLQTRKCVADIRKMGVISIESQKWVVDILLPGMIKHLGGEMPIVAQLLDRVEIFAKVAANKINEKVKDDKNGFRVMQFTERKAMEAYLKSV